MLILCGQQNMPVDPKGNSQPSRTLNGEDKYQFFAGTGAYRTFTTLQHKFMIGGDGLCLLASSVSCFTNLLKLWFYMFCCVRLTSGNVVVLYSHLPALLIPGISVFEHVLDRLTPQHEHSSILT